MGKAVQSIVHNPVKAVTTAVKDTVKSVKENPLKAAGGVAGALTTAGAKKVAKNGWVAKNVPGGGDTVRAFTNPLDLKGRIAAVGETVGELTGQNKNRREMIAAGEREVVEQQKLVEEQIAEGDKDEQRADAIAERNRQRARQRMLAGGGSRSGTLLTGSLGTPGGGGGGTVLGG